ncbi:hypothetical protein [Lactobacillus sp. PV034]|uniref:hypothetical protein n=1 Tax=Lactobacillus sp. PV034 TaxID=2594495 RepID=UPI00223E9B49|nr:hypothetical protein [Lactobacillus sp. PV034]
MKKKVLNLFLKLILGLSLLLGTIATVQLLVPAQTTFASMGSTGGGSSDFSGGGSSSDYSTSYSYDSSTDSSDDNESDSPLWQKILAGIVLGVIVFLALIDSVGDFIWYVFQFFLRMIRLAFIRLHLFYQYGGKHLAYDFIKPNIELSELEEAIRENKIELKEISQASKYKNFSDVYIKAQFLYSQDLRERYVNKRYSLRNLLEYLDKNYYWVMKNEIKLKVKQATIDDTVVSNARVVKIARLSENVWLTQIDASGKDKEVQFNKDFNDSFTRSQWSDYVIFGKDREGQIKIINLVYGEHFHLDGKDFNHQKSLGSGGYRERK